MSSDSAGSERRRYGEHVQAETSKQERYRRRNRLKAAVEEANKALVRGRHDEAGVILRDIILPLIDGLQNRKPMSEYHRKLATDNDVAWHWSELKEFRHDPGRIIALVDEGDSPTPSRLTTVQRGAVTGREGARRVVRRALDSAEAITTYHDITDSGLTSRADVRGFSLKIGEHLQDYEMDLGDEVVGVTSEAGALKTLMCGGTGDGKSTGAEREFEDYYQRQFRGGGRRVKCLDLVGLRDGENWFYDIPQKQDILRDIREDQGLAADFSADDSLGEPSVEIRVPLTPGVARHELPFDTEREEFVVEPFVVPASSIRKTLMVQFIASRLSEGQEETIRSAYEAVNREQDDWSLRDLAEEIRGRDELPPKNKATAVNVLRSLQDQGFIRTADHPRCLDWRDIFEDTETITVFSQALCEDKVSKYITFAYLVHEIYQKRETMYGIPQCAMLMREFWKVAPHSRRQSPFVEVAALQEATAQMLSEIFRENRHGGIHVIADTQAPRDLHKAVREMFNRYVIYSSTKDTLKDIFEWTQNDHWRSMWHTMSPKSGEAGIIGQVEPAIENRDIEFLSPVQYAPPSHHHRVSPGDDVGVAPDQNGWEARCRHHDHEELRRPCDVEGAAWDDSLPPELEIDAVQADDNALASPEDAPVAAFADRCLAEGTLSDHVHKSDVYDAFNEFRKKHKLDRWDFDQRQRQVTFGKRLKNHVDYDIDNKQRDGEYALIGVHMTNLARELLSNARTEVQSSAAPITGDD